MALVERVQAMLLRPRDAWPEVRNEQTTIRDLYLSYAVILAAIPPLAQLIGMTVIGISFLGVRYRAPFLGAAGYAVVSYLLSLAGLYVFALVLDVLAPRFGSRRNFLNAMKLSVYSSTAYWIAGILLIYPILSPVMVILSAYGFFLFYLGLPVLMETPRHKIALYFIITVIVGIIISALTGIFATLCFPQGRMGIA